MKRVVVLTMMLLIVYLFIGCCGVTSSVKGGVKWNDIIWYGNIVERVGETDVMGDLPKTIVKKDGLLIIFD